MPRKKTVLSREFPYHVTTRSNNRAWFQLDLEDVWKIGLESLQRAQSKHPVEVHAFVLINPKQAKQVPCSFCFAVVM